jgi:hypothetical protein
LRARKRAACEKRAAFGARALTRAPSPPRQERDEAVAHFSREGGLGPPDLCWLRKARGAALIVPDDAAAGGAPIQATRCRTGTEAACLLRRLKEALWVWARDAVPGLEDTAAREERRACAALRPGAGGGSAGKHVPRLSAMTAAARG